MTFLFFAGIIVLDTKSQFICKVVKSLVSNSALVLFDFHLRERLENQTDAKLLTSELTILQMYRPKVFHDLKVSKHVHEIIIFLNCYLSNIKIQMILKISN